MGFARGHLARAFQLVTALAQHMVFGHRWINFWASLGKPSFCFLQIFLRFYLMLFHWFLRRVTQFVNNEICFTLYIFSLVTSYGNRNRPVAAHCFELLQGQEHLQQLPSASCRRNTVEQRLSAIRSAVHSSVSSRSLHISSVCWVHSAKLHMWKEVATLAAHSEGGESSASHFTGEPCATLAACETFKAWHPSHNSDICFKTVRILCLVILSCDWFWFVVFKRLLGCFDESCL